MTRWRDMDTKDKVVLWIAGVVGIFMVLSLVAVFVLTLADRETGSVWDQVFNLVSVMAGALVGYITGRTLERAKKPEPPDEIDPYAGEDDD